MSTIKGGAMRGTAKGFVTIICVGCEEAITKRQSMYYGQKRYCKPCGTKVIEAERAKAAEKAAVEERAANMRKYLADKNKARRKEKGDKILQDREVAKKKAENNNDS